VAEGEAQVNRPVVGGFDIRRSSSFAYRLLWISREKDVGVSQFNASGMPSVRLVIPLLFAIVQNRITQTATRSQPFSAAFRVLPSITKYRV
jgi:hypothetical protein